MLPSYDKCTNIRTTKIPSDHTSAWPQPQPQVLLPVGRSERALYYTDNREGRTGRAHLHRLFIAVMTGDRTPCFCLHKEEISSLCVHVAINERGR